MPLYDDAVLGAERGVGGAEAAFGLLYAPLVPTAVLTTAIALWRFSVFYFPLALGALLFLILSRSSPRRQEAS